MVSKCKVVSSRNVSIISMSVALVAAALPSTAYAQDVATDDQADGSQLTEIIVTAANRREQTKQEVAAAVEAVSGVELENLAVIDTRALVTISPSVGFQTGFSLNSGGFLIRGITSQSSEGGIQQSTAMIVDGVPLARPGEFVNDLGDLERVEILRGPQGTLFGKNATAGLISLVTRSASDEFEGQVQLGATTDEEYSVRAMLNIPLSDSVRTRFNAFYSDLDPLVPNIGPGKDLYGMRNYAFRGRVDADLSDDVRLSVKAEYTNQRTSFSQPLLLFPNSAFSQLQIAILGYTPRPGLAISNTNADSIEKAEGYNVTAELIWDINDSITMTSLSAYRSFETDQNFDTDATPLGFDARNGLIPDTNPLEAAYPIRHVTIALPRFPTKVNYFTQELRFNYSGSSFDAVAGLFYQTLTDEGSNQVPFLIRNPAIPLPPGAFLYSNAQNSFEISNDTFAIFADATWRVTDTFSIFGGLRYTHESIITDYSVRDFGPNFALGAAGLSVAIPGVNFNTTTGVYSGPPVSTRSFNIGDTTNDLSGRLGVQWQPTESMNFYASYNRGYKGSAVDVSRAARAPDPVTGYTPIVAPEKAESWEVGTKHDLFDNRVQFALALYTMTIDNLQQNVLIPGTTSTFLINAGAIKSRGVEFDARARVVDGLTLDGAVAYVDAFYTGRFSNGNPVLIACYPGQTVAQGCVNGQTTTAGVQARGSFEWRYNVGATYETSLGSLPFGLEARVTWNWFDDAPQNVGIDPLMREPSHGLLDATLTFRDNDDRWSLQLYGKNLTDDFYYGNRSNPDGSIGRVIGWLPRDFQAYGGLRFTYNF